MRHWEGGMSSSQEKQVNAKKQKRMAGWREEQHPSGVVRGWMVRKVNSKQKNQEEANIKFRQATRSNQVTG